MGNNNGRRNTLLGKIKALKNSKSRLAEARINESSDDDLEMFLLTPEQEDLVVTGLEDLGEQQNMVEIYDKMIYKKELRRLDDDRNPRFVLIKNLLDTPSSKPLSKITREKLIGIERLKKEFSLFEEFLTDISDLLELEMQGQGVIKIAPKLLLGPPGVGKTRLINELGKVLDVGRVRQIDLANTSGGFVIGGHSTQWKDGSQGVVTKTLLDAPSANPIIVLDEVDKAAKNGHQPEGALYNLLERHTAEAFIDEALELPMNCSHIIWLATANSLDDVPSPIMSRFDIYEIAEPSELQMRGVVNSVFNELLSENEWGILFNLSLSSAVMNLLQERSARDLSKNLRRACAKALQRDKCFTGKRDDLISLMTVDFEQSYSAKPNSSIGFY